MTEKEFIKLRYKAESGIADVREEAALSNYKVDNAIIMAAGFSARCMPLSNELPKGLFRVKGEVLIEREIRQLREAGIEHIIVVTGYKHEKFAYLKDKYGVILVHNEDYDKYNNIGSLYVVREMMRNSYILCCDNYYKNNEFHKYVYEPYYSCTYSDGFVDEFCVTEYDDNEIIRNIIRGGKKSWFTIGDCYFSRKISDIFVERMVEEWEVPETRNLLMDEFHIRHIDELPLKMKKHEEGEILEFDTLEEFRAFDHDFTKFEKENVDDSNPVNQVFERYSGISSYHSVPTEQLSGRLHLNENLFKPSPRCFDVLKNITMEDLYLYDLQQKDELVESISRQTLISSNNIFVHNGSSEVIKSIFSILLNDGDVVLIPSPGWSYYKSVADAKFAKCVTYQVQEKENTYEYSIEDILHKSAELHPKLIVVTVPQMPTGCMLDNDRLEEVVKKNPESVIMIDEAYWGYANDSSEFERHLILTYNNVVISRTFSKFYGLANIRIGYGLCSYPLRRTIGLDLPLFRASGISRKIAMAAIEDTEYYDRMRQETIEVTKWFAEELNALYGVTAYQSGSNFIFIKIDDVDADRVRAFMEENGILIRLFTDKDALRLRITIAPRNIMERVLLQLKRALNR